MGAGHGVTCGVTEFGLVNNNANVTANSYSSILGTFADNNVELFTPWYWYPGMWETLHLFSRYAKGTRVQSVSSNELNVSAYSSVNIVGDSMTVVLVNRNLSAAHVTTINLTNFTVPNGNYDSKQLKNLPSSETFVSNTVNALSTGTITATSNSFSISLPALSTTAIILKGTAATGVQSAVGSSSAQLIVWPNPGSTIMNLAVRQAQGENYEIQITNMLGEDMTPSAFPIGTHSSGISPKGEKFSFDVNSLQNGVYFISVRDLQQRVIATKKIVIQH